DHVGRAGGNEDIVNVSPGGDIEWGVVTTPTFIAIHLGGEIEEELLSELFRAVSAGLDCGIQAAANNAGKVDPGGLPINKRNAAGGQVRARRISGPVGFPRIIRKVNAGRPPELRAGLSYASLAVEQSEPCTRRWLENTRFGGICQSGERCARQQDRDASEGDSDDRF